MMAQKPLMLKDYLEQDFDSESSNSSGFRCAPRRADTVRCLLEAELRRSGSEGAGRRQIVRGARSTNTALMKLSAVINAVKLLPFSSSSSSSSSPGGGSDGYSGSFSKRLITGSFWKSKRARHQKETEKVLVRDVVLRRSSEEDDANEHRSFHLPSPVSNCRSWSETVSSSSTSDFLPSSVSSTENQDFIPAVAVESMKDSSQPGTPKPAEAAAGRHRPPPKDAEGKGLESLECQLEDEEDKEQLSPVSVMDFPYEEEEDGEEDDDDLDEGSPSFSQTLANIERTKLQLLQKIRRFESLAELDGVDLETRFEDLSTSDDEGETASDVESDGGDGAMSRTAETRASVLVEELRSATHTLGCFEKLLLDFFVQALGGFDERGNDVNLGRPSRSKGAEASSAPPREEWMLREARDWMRGDVDGRSGDATIMAMEGNGRWRCHGEEEEELGADVEGYLFGMLVDEMVVHLASS